MTAAASLLLALSMHYGNKNAIQTVHSHVLYVTRERYQLSIFVISYSEVELLNIEHVYYLIGIHLVLAHSKRFDKLVIL